MRINWYPLFKNVLIGPFLQVWNRPTAVGMEHIPSSGPVIIASNHQSVFDSFYLGLKCPRRITYLSKKEYFTGTGIIGGIQRWFFTAVGQVPVDRTGADAAKAALNTAVNILSKGNVLGIYPEGTRSPDGRLYKGKTGVARVALATGAPIVPVAMQGTRRANPIGSWILRPVKVSMIVGEPFDPVAFAKQRGLAVEPDDYEAARAVTNELMARLQALSGQEYVDRYGADVKASLAAGDGYPDGVSPPSQH